MAQLVALQRSALDYAERDGRLDSDAQFAAAQDARLVVNAEHYYRQMLRGARDGLAAAPQLPLIEAFTAESNAIPTT